MINLKIFWISFLLLFVHLSLDAQIIQTEPSFPIDNDSVTLVYDATQGNGALAGYSGNVYAHTGVITNLSDPPDAWRYKVAGWSENIDKTRMEALGNDKYQLTMTPSIREWYGVPGGEEIQKMAFVFRNSDGSIVGRASDGSDIYVDVYQEGLNVSFLKPIDDTIVQPNDSISIKVISNNAEKLILSIDDTEVTQVNDTVLTYKHEAVDPGNHWIKAEAQSLSDTITDSISYHVRGSVQVQSLPGGVREGINYIDDTTVTFVLFSPGKEFAYVMGDFTDWKVQEEFQMKRTPNDSIFWLTADNLEADTKYIFQYFIDGELKIADPYSEQVSTPNDKYISSETFPDLIPYPESKTTEIASVLQTGQYNYNWSATDFEPPANKDLVIYEMHIRDFIEKHNYQTLIDTLGYFRELGINAIELMPVNEFEGNSSWGYNPDFYFAPDKYYGPKEKLKEFIDSCHQNNIAVILDMVLNHSYGLNPMVRMYFDPGLGEWGQPTSESPWFNQTCQHEPWCWGFDFNHQSPHTRKFVDSVNTYWLQEYNVDGFRFDFTKGFTNTTYGAEGWNYNAERIANIKRMSDKIWDVDQDAYVILEHFTDNSEEKELAEYGCMVWGNYNSSYNEATMGYNENGKSNFSGISYKEHNWSVPHLVGYMESHDEERLMYKNLSYGNSTGDYNIQQLDTALNRIELAAAFFFTVPGPKMIWQFGELGYDVSIEYDCRTCPKPIRWEYFNQESRRDLFNTFKDLINLRQKYEVFQTPDITMNVASKMKKIQLLHDSMDVIVVGNFGVTSGIIEPNFTEKTTWYEFFSGDSIEVNNYYMDITLEPGEYKLYSTKQLELEENSPVTGFGLNQTNGEEKVKVYPNPSGSVFYFEFETPAQKPVELEIYNTIGQKLLTIEKGRTTKGINKIRWNSEINSNVKSGIYFYRLIVGEKQFSGKLFKE